MHLLTNNLSGNASNGVVFKIYRDDISSPIPDQSHIFLITTLNLIQWSGCVLGILFAWIGYIVVLQQSANSWSYRVLRHCLQVA